MLLVMGNIESKRDPWVAMEHYHSRKNLSIRRGNELFDVISPQKVLKPLQFRKCMSRLNIMTLLEVGLQYMIEK